MKYSSKELFYFFLNRLPKTLWGKYISHNLIHVHWGRGLNNFGDCLQPYIARHYGLLPVYVTSQRKSDIILQGSILQTIPNDYKGYILGTGGDQFDYDFPFATVIGVRGKLSRSNLIKFHPERGNVLLGDTGLLMAKVFPEQVKKIYNLGIILHFVDHNTEVAKKYKENFESENVLFINVLESPAKVIKQIKQCKNIISSSLHGLIIADAFGIPNIRIVDRKTMPTPFYDYKFEDYYSSIDMKHDFIQVDGNESYELLLSECNIKNQKKIRNLIANLDNSMRALSNRFKH